MKSDLLKAGKIVNTHSLRGEVRIYPYCDGPEFLCEFDRLYIEDTETEIVSARVHKGQALIKFKGVNSINDAELLVGKPIYINKNDVELEDGRYFIEDIKGLEVIDIDTDEVYGKVVNVIETGANDVFEVEKNGKILLVPKIDDVVKEIDINGGKILIKPIKGLFE